MTAAAIAEGLSEARKRDVEALVSKLRKARGTPAEWLEREMIVLRMVAGLNDTTRVFCRGEVRHPDKGHFPAVLTYNTIYRQTLAWAASGKKNALEGHHEALFYSTVPHVEIAQEVMTGPETRAVTMPDPAVRACLGGVE